MMSFFARQRRQWSYRLFGPTVLHLQHEIYLWISLSLLTLSSLQGLYRQPLQWGDIVLVFWVSLWLSRHLVMRWLCTHDTETSMNPTIIGVIMHWITSHVSAGHYMDRPDPGVAAKNVGTPNEELALMPSLAYTLHFLRVRIWYPLMGYKEHLAPDREHSSSSKHRDRSAGGVPNNLATSWRNSTYFTWIQWWRQHGPPIQMYLAITVAVALVWETVASIYPPRPGGTEFELIQPRGVYRQLEQPTWSLLALSLSRTSILLSIFWYGRISLPIPDLVAGANVLKSLRAEARYHGSRANPGGKSSKIKNQVLKEDVPWAEHYKSIAVENRFRLACKVAGIRIIDGIVACAILPRTKLACSLTGHCPTRPALWELSSILYPVGLTGPRPTNVGNAFSALVPDRGALLVVACSVIVIPALLLLAQIVVLNGSYLAIMGYLSEWTLVEDPPQDFAAPAHWDPRRRYKKGDLVTYSGLGGGVYRATSNSPEGRPFDLCLRATRDLFRCELGHASTSQVIAVATKLHMLFIGAVMVMIVGYSIMSYATDALLTALFANLIACYGLVTVGLMDHRELEAVANEINPKTT